MNLLKRIAQALNPEESFPHPPDLADTDSVTFDHREFDEAEAWVYKQLKNGRKVFFSDFYGDTYVFVIARSSAQAVQVLNNMDPGRDEEPPKDGEETITEITSTTDIPSI